MEMYVWMLLGALAVGYLVKTYWDVYRAWRAWMDSEAARATELVAAPVARTPSRVARALGWLAERGDRFLHALLMSPTAR